MGMQYGMTYGTTSSSSGSAYSGTSSATYRNLARGWEDTAESLNATITSLTESVNYASGQLTNVKAVKAKLDEAAQLQVTAEEDVAKLGTDLKTATEIAGAQEYANSLGSNTTLQISEAQEACQSLIDKLEDEISAFNSDLSTAQESYDDAVAKAASYRSAANIAATRERGYQV